MLSFRNKQRSRDGSIKFLWETPEQRGVETLFMNHPEKEYNELCLSTQIGCAVGCEFCHVPLKSEPINLSTEEIVSQVRSVIEHFEESGNHGQTDDLQIVYFGAGEPMHNLGNVLESKSVLEDRYADYLKPNVVGRLQRFSVSTSGWKPGIDALSDLDTSVDLQVSLHATDQWTRNEIIPRTKTYQIEEILDAAEEFSVESGRKVTLNYLLIDGLNDSPEDLEWLKTNIDPDRFSVTLSHLNNPRLETLENSPRETFELFERELRDAGIESHIFESSGRDVEAGCGEMKGYKRLNN